MNDNDNDKNSGKLFTSDRTRKKSFSPGEKSEQIGEPSKSERLEKSKNSFASAATSGEVSTPDEVLGGPSASDKVAGKSQLPKMTILYWISNIFAEQLFSNPEFVTAVLNVGTENLKNVFANAWHSYRQEFLHNDEVQITDIERQVTGADFSAERDNTQDGKDVIFITFPDTLTDETMSETKCLAVVVGRDGDAPRMFTMEYYAEGPEFKHNGKFVLGEWKNVEGKRVHLNRGVMQGSTVADFLTLVREMKIDDMATIDEEEI